MAFYVEYWRNILSNFFYRDDSLLYGNQLNKIHLFCFRRENYDNENPLIPEKIDLNDGGNSQKTSREIGHCNDISLEHFQEETTDSFQQFVSDLKVNKLTNTNI